MRGAEPDLIPNRSAYGTLEYYQQELGPETPWRQLDAARSLADKAVSNFRRVLMRDHKTPLGVNAADTEMDEAMIADVEAQCEELYQKIVRDIQTAIQLAV